MLMSKSMTVHQKLCILYNTSTLKYHLLIILISIQRLSLDPSCKRLGHCCINRIGLWKFHLVLNILIFIVNLLWYWLISQHVNPTFKVSSEYSAQICDIDDANQKVSQIFQWFLYTIIIQFTIRLFHVCGQYFAKYNDHILIRKI